MSLQDLEACRGLASWRRDHINGKEDVTQAVASGIVQINTAVSSFHLLVRSLGTLKDTPELREKLHKTRLHIGELVKDTSARLKEASETDHHSGVSPGKKITDVKLAKDFQAVLKELQKAQRTAAEMETAYASSVQQAFLHPSFAADELKMSSDKSLEQCALLIESRRYAKLHLRFLFSHFVDFHHDRERDCHESSPINAQDFSSSPPSFGSDIPQGTVHIVHPFKESKINKPETDL